MSRPGNDEQLGLGFFSDPEGAGEDASGPVADRAPVPSAVPRLVESLREATLADPLGRKILVAETRGEGRELLRSLARAGRPWVGWEVQTPRPLALELAGPALASEGLRVLDEFDEQALLDRAIDRALIRHARPSEAQVGFEALSEAMGFRNSLADSVRALRLGGVSAERLARTRLDDPDKKALLHAALSELETALATERAVDGGALLARATREVEEGGAERLGGSVHLVPGLGTRGRAGEFLAALGGRGAEVLTTDPVEGLEAPSALLWRQQPSGTALSRLHAGTEEGQPVPGLASFVAAGIEEELREVLRRVLAAGWAWDEVEIVTPDPQAYGSALHALAARLGIPVTFGVGLQVARTRPGRAVAAYLRWIEGGFQAADVRRLLESGDLRPPGEVVPDAMALGRRFRELRIGWGRERTRTRIDERLAALDRRKPRVGEHPDAFARRVADARAELGALKAILTPVLEATPPIPAHPLARDAEAIAPADLARGLRAFLAFVPAENAVDETAHERLDRVLDRIAATLHRKTTYASAAATLRTHVALRVPAPRVEGKAPWSSDGGHLYLTDLEHGGATGRRATFVVGLDAQRFPGAETQDPLLLDRERRRLGDGGLPTASDRTRVRRFRLAALLARLRGPVTLSWCGWDPAEARARAPAAEILQAARLHLGNPRASFEDLRKLVGDPVATVPPREGLALDARDVWMRALFRDGSLRRGTGVVRAAYPHLALGGRAFDALREPIASAWIGQVAARPRLDLRTSERVLSASRLEALGTCPRRYLYNTVWRLYAPDEPQWDPDRWLDARARGTLLHDTYERLLRTLRERGLREDDPSVSDIARRILLRRAESMLDEVPAPSEEVHRKELDRLLDDLQSFVGMIAAEGAPWVALEATFGFAESAPVALPIRGGRLLTRGRIDRVDARAEGLHIIDYKTGSTYAFDGEKGVFDGGRRLQHFVYWAAVRALFDQPIASMEYHFPTHRAVNERIAFVEKELRPAPEILGKLFDAVAGGHFLPTDDQGDCRFCDFQAICRVRTNRRGEVEESPPARWAAEFGASLPETRSFRSARKHEEDGYLIPPGPLEEHFERLERGEG